MCVTHCNRSTYSIQFASREVTRGEETYHKRIPYSFFFFFFCCCCCCSPFLRSHFGFFLCSVFTMNYKYQESAADHISTFLRFRSLTVLNILFLTGCCCCFSFVQFCFNSICCYCWWFNQFKTFILMSVIHLILYYLIFDTSCKSTALKWKKRVCVMSVFHVHVCAVFLLSLFSLCQLFFSVLFLDCCWWFVSFFLILLRRKHNTNRFSTQHLNENHKI